MVLSSPVCFVPRVFCRILHLHRYQVHFLIRSCSKNHLRQNLWLEGKQKTEAWRNLRQTYRHRAEGGYLLSNVSYTGINQHLVNGPVTCPSHDIATAAQVKILHPPHSFFLRRHLLIYPLAAYLARKSSIDQCHSFHLIWSRRKSSQLIIRAKSLRPPLNEEPASDKNCGASHSYHTSG